MTVIGRNIIYMVVKHNKNQIKTSKNKISLSEKERTALVAKNTFLLYMRMVLIMLVSLYSTRILLKTLGVSDYGINDVVAGVVSTLGFVNTSLSAATQRFLSHAIGKGDNSKLRKIFSASVNIYIIISISVLIVGETIGFWFINEKLVIPDERINAANWLFQFALIACVCSMLSVPYISTIIAHEHMSLYAIVGLTDCFLKLVLVFVLGYVPFDKLIIYGIFSMLVHVLTASIYIFFARNLYEESHYQFIRDKSIHKQLFSFSGWTFFGALSFMANSQGINIIINIFLGPLVNAARAVASQVSSAISLFCNSFFMALRPAMVKVYAEGDYKYLEKLFFFSNKYTYYLLLIFCLPAILTVDYILHLWLGDITYYIQIFTKLSIVYSIVLAMQNPITIIIQATGNIKYYFLIIESFTLLTLPISYVLLKAGYEPEATYYAMIIVFIIAHFLRLIILNRQINYISIKKYMMHFAIPAATISCALYFSLNIIKDMIKVDSLFKLFTFVIISVALVSCIVYLFALNDFEKSNIKSIIKR